MAKPKPATKKEQKKTMWQLLMWLEKSSVFKNKRAKPTNVGWGTG